jgi:hypothetical protein
MRITWFIIIALVNASCIHSKSEIRTIKRKGFVLVDTNRLSTEYLQGQQDVDFPIYYIGPFKDTIRIGRRYWRGRTPVTLWPKRFPVSRTYSNRTLSVEVDTSFVTNSPLEYFSKDGTIDLDSTRNYYASVFTIKNISDSIIWMGRTFSVFFLHREFKNRQGQWVQVGKNLSEVGICGTLQPHIYLRPGEIILSKVAHYKGSFVTDCRLVFGYDERPVYSNIFKESIDEKILQGDGLTETSKCRVF